MKLVLAFSVRPPSNHVHEEKNCCGYQKYVLKVPYVGNLKCIFISVMFAC